MKRYFSVLALIFVVLSSCNSIKVVTDMDPTVDFTEYKTYEYYGWAKDSDKILTDLDRDRIEKAFAKEFSKRGFSRVDDDGDLVVSLHIITEQKTQKTAQTNHYGGGYGYGGRYGYGPGWGYGMGHSTTTITEYNYTVGTLIISVYDKKEKKLVWESIGSKTLGENGKNREMKVNKSALAMMRTFPTKPISE